MFAEVKDDLVPFAPGYSPGCTLAGEELPWAGRAELQKMGLKGAKPYPALLHLQSFPISQMLGTASGQEGGESWGRFRQTISRQRGGTGNWEKLDCFPAGNVQAPELNHEWRTAEQELGHNQSLLWSMMLKFHPFSWVWEGKEDDYNIFHCKLFR